MSIILCPTCQAQLQVPDTALGKNIRCPKCTAKFVASIDNGKSPASTPIQKTAAAKIIVRCPGCQKQLSAPTSAAGNTIQCPHCSKRLRLPAGDAPARPTAASHPTRAQSVPSKAPAQPTSPAFDDIFGGIPSSHTPMNPYATQAAMTGGYSPVQRPASRSVGSGQRPPVLYTINGVFIGIWGLMFVVASIFRGFGLAMVFLNAEIPDAEYPRFIGMIVGMFIGFLIGIILCIGAFGLLTQSNLSAARSAAIISAIPCIGCFVFPFGIWSCILLYSEPAKRDFSS